MVTGLRVWRWLRFVRQQLGEDLLRLALSLSERGLLRLHVILVDEAIFLLRFKLSVDVGVGVILEQGLIHHGVVVHEGGHHARVFVQVRGLSCQFLGIARHGVLVRQIPEFSH